MLRIASALVIVAVLAVAWAVWNPADPELGSDPATVAGPNPATPTTTPSVAEPAPTVPKEERTSSQERQWWADALTADEPVPATDETDPSRAVVLRGRLTVRQQPWLHPANVEVRVTRSWLDSVVPIETDAGNRTPQRDEPRTRTDKDGRFAFRFVPGGAELFFLIGHDTEWLDFQKIAKLPRAGQELDLGDVFLDQRGSIVGRVDAYHGNELVARAVDDPLLDGKAGFADVSTSRLEGAEFFRTPGTMRGGPVPDWVVYRDRFLPFPKGAVDKTGRFRIDGVRPGNHDVFLGDSQSSGRSSGVLVAAGRTTDIGTVSMRQSDFVHLRFVDDEKKPWAFANVAFVHSSGGFGSAPVRTDRDGWIRDYVPDLDSRSMMMSLPGGGPWFELRLPPKAERDGNQIVVARPKELIIVLEDERGHALSKGTVRTYADAQLFRATDRRLPLTWQPHEERPGRYVGKTQFPVVVVASVPGHAPALAEVKPGTSTVLKLLSLQRMTVRTIGLDRQPIAGAMVRVQVHENPDLVCPGSTWNALANDRVTLGLTDERGELLVPVWPTFFSFRASHRDYAPSTGGKVFGNAGSTHEIVLRGGGDIHGTLTVEMRPAPRGLRVRARQRPPDGHTEAGSGFLDERLAVTGDGGTFALRDLIAGNWELEPELPMLPSANGARRNPMGAPILPVQIDAGQELHVTLALQPGHFAAASITGVLKQNGGAVAGALVRLRELESPAMRQRNAQRADMQRITGDDSSHGLGPMETTGWLARCETDAYGDFRFRDLREGSEYELRFDLPVLGRLQFLERRIVRAGSTLSPLRIDTAFVTAPIQLTCSTPTGAYANRMVRLRQIVEGDQEGTCFELLLDSNGILLLEALPVGKWTIEPMHGGRCEPGEFELLAGQAPGFAFQVKGTAMRSPTKTRDDRGSAAKRR